MTCGIYKIVCLPSGKFYIGSSVDIERRWSAHRWSLSNGNHRSRYMQRAWDKYGPSLFEFAIVETVDRDFLLLAEQKHLDAGSDYNSAKIAGSTLGVRPSAESRLKMSIAGKGKIISEAEREKRRQRRHSLETRKKMSLSAIGNKNANGPKSQEHIAKIAAAQKGKLITQAQRDAISRANTGRLRTPEVRAAMSAARKGIASRSGFVTPPDVRKKISIANTGKKRSPETCARLSEVGKARWARERAMSP
jgi:group I intron endonuclease